MKGGNMKLNPPTKIVFWLSTVVAVLGILGKFIGLPIVTGNEFWFVVVGFVLLWLGNTMKGF